MAAAIIAFCIAAVGWYYLFYSRAAKRLEGLEDQRLNAWRVLCRRACGASLMLMAVLFFAGFQTIDPDARPGEFVADWMAVFALLVLILALGLADLRLTTRLRRRQQGRQAGPRALNSERGRPAGGCNAGR